MIDESLRITHLWIDTVFDIDNHWDRLRTIGSAEDINDGIANLTFFPIRQRIPALNIKTRPEMAESGTSQILSEYNTLYDLCELQTRPKCFCHMIDEELEILGKKIKFQLRMSNFTYPHLFSEIEQIPTALAYLGQEMSALYRGVPILDIHAYDESILITGGPIGHAEDWPAGYSVKEVDYSKRLYKFQGVFGEDITLPSTVSNFELGKLVVAVWRAKKGVLETRR